MATVVVIGEQKERVRERENREREGEGGSERRERGGDSIEERAVNVPSQMISSPCLSLYGSNVSLPC